MTNTLTKKPDLSSNLSIYDPAVLALFAKASYDVRKLGNNVTEKDKNKAQKVIDSWLPANKSISDPWEIIDIDGGIDGFQGVAIGRKGYDDSYEEIVFAFRGTDSGYDWTTSNLQIFAKVTPEQKRKALNFYNKVMNDNNCSGAFVTITGHSLGGALAQIVAVEKDKRAVTFNAPGMYEQCNKNDSM